MELTAFKTIPEELIRIIIDYARPTYPYIEELKVLGEKYHREWKHYFIDNPYIKQIEKLKREMPKIPAIQNIDMNEVMMGVMTLSKYKRENHRKLWTFYKIFGLYGEVSEGGREMKMFSYVIENLNSKIDLRKRLISYQAPSHTENGTHSIQDNPRGTY